MGISTSILVATVCCQLATRNQCSVEAFFQAIACLINSQYVGAATNPLNISNLNENIDISILLSSKSQIAGFAESNNPFDKLNVNEDISISKLPFSGFAESDDPGHFQILLPLPTCTLCLFMR